MIPDRLLDVTDNERWLAVSKLGLLVSSGAEGDVVVRAPLCAKAGR